MSVPERYFVRALLTDFQSGQVLEMPHFLTTDGHRGISTGKSRPGAFEACSTASDAPLVGFHVLVDLSLEHFIRRKNIIYFFQNIEKKKSSRIYPRWT